VTAPAISPAELKAAPYIDDETPTPPELLALVDFENSSTR